MIDLHWFDAIESRRSRRRFDGRPLDKGDAQRLANLCESFRPFPDVRAEYVPVVHPDMFRGLLGSYGKVRGASAALAFVGPDEAGLEVGYVGEALILEATLLGVGTCWIAASFDKTAAAALVQPRSGNRVHAITPLGYPAERRGSERTLTRMLNATSRLPVEQIARTLDETWPDWAVEAVRAARLAPSGANRQPWSFGMDDGSLTLTLQDGKTYWTRELDCGIAMLHAELGALHAGVPAHWEFRRGDERGRLTPVAST